MAVTLNHQAEGMAGKEYGWQAGEVCLLLLRGDRVLCGKLSGNGHGGDCYRPPSGYLQAGELMADAIARLARQVAGVTVAARDISFAHVMHDTRGHGRIRLYFTVTCWDGEPIAADTGESGRLRWFPLHRLSASVTDDVRAAIGHYIEGQVFSVYPGPGPVEGKGTFGIAAAVAAFHAAFGLPMRERPSADVGHALASLRVALLREEAEEFVTASEQGDLPGIADALADIVYVVYGTALTYGIDLDLALREVHRSNMSKLGKDGKPLIRADGKVLKSEQYFRPDIAAVLGRQPPLPLP